MGQRVTRASWIFCNWDGHHPQQQIEIRASIQLGPKFRFCSKLRPAGEGLNVAEANLTVCIHPLKCNRISEGILRELSTLLFMFNEFSDGVLLAYGVNVLDKNEKNSFRGSSLFWCETKGRSHTFLSKARCAVSFDEETLHIFGSLMPAHTGGIHWLDRNSKDVSVLDSTKKRKDEDGQIPEHRG
ncbi:hypothetical protein SLEP1_g4118 [Rubroshorea leprosula]|uniref:Uncharacterized protein n=1 Tax=Rubroshorea leprosula TaxID=152421 RepID=A0AAV5HWF2_9ROSI|nr:hypothetical protein SLEP1_g4118 [Rubroshorea leprosula]